MEAITNHDVKAVEYFLKEKLDSLGMADSKEFIHFGLTSQDINNTAVPLSLKEFKTDILFPVLDDILSMLTKPGRRMEGHTHVGHTHGQPASPTRLGKEMMVFVERLESQINVVKNIPTSAKFGGATGNFNAHVVAYPAINWKEFADRFLYNELGLTASNIPHKLNITIDWQLFAMRLKRINTILT